MSSRIAQLTYAIGDIHGYDAVFERLIDRIRIDADLLGERPRVVLLGDYIDRGPTSKEVLARILRLERATWCDMVALKGNHEDALLRFLAEPESGETWRIWGGAATLASYGVDMPYLCNDLETWADISAEFAHAIDPAHLDLLQRMPPIFQGG